VCYPTLLWIIGILIAPMAAIWAAEASPAGEAPLADVTRRLQSGDPLVFATFGDSITWPCFHTDFRQNYVTLTVDALRKAHPRANVQIVHAGNMGTTGRGLADDRYQHYVLDQHPDVVFLMFGMNDCGAGPAGLDAFDHNLTELIEKAEAAGARPVVLTQNAIIYDCPDGAGRGALPVYMRRAIEVARREQIPFVDCFADWQSYAQDRPALIARLNDWIHPNLAGHRLFAKSIVAALWPDAARYVDTSVHPQPVGPATPCLLPGPSGKQVLLTPDRTWFTVSGRKRGERISDLVLSYSSAEQPAWGEFAHVTLIGPDEHALLPDDDREITAAALLEGDSTLFVVFSWNTGVYLLAFDRSQPDWQERINTIAAWKDLDADPFPRPTPILNSQLGNGLLLDAFLADAGTPVVLCRDRQFAQGAGWEVLDGTDGISMVSGTGDARTVQFLLESNEFAAERLPLRIAHEPGATAFLLEQDGALEFRPIPEKSGAEDSP
jgi:acyl-CoA thioesterase I